MAHQNTPAERQLLKLIETLPLAAELKTGWNDQMHATGMSVELEEEIRQKLAEDKDLTPAVRAHYDVELARWLRQWRMEAGAKSFHK